MYLIIKIPHTLRVINNVDPTGVDSDQHRDVLVCQQTGQATERLLYLTLEERCPDVKQVIKRYDLFEGFLLEGIHALIQY